MRKTNVRAVFAENRGLSLLETSLIVILSIGVIGGGLSYFHQSREGQRVASTVKSSLLLQTHVDDLAQSPGGANMPAGDLTEYIRATGLSAFQSQDDTNLRHPWGGEVEVTYHGDRTMEITLDDLSATECKRLATEMFIGKRFEGYDKVTGFIIEGQLVDASSQENYRTALSLCDQRQAGQVGWVYAPSLATITMASLNTTSAGSGGVVVAAAAATGSAGASGAGSTGSGPARSGPSRTGPPVTPAIPGAPGAGATPASPASGTPPTTSSRNSGSSTVVASTSRGSGTSTNGGRMITRGAVRTNGIQRFQDPVTGETVFRNILTSPTRGSLVRPRPPRP